MVDLQVNKRGLSEPSNNIIIQWMREWGGNDDKEDWGVDPPKVGQLMN